MTVSPHVQAVRSPPG